MDMDMDMDMSSTSSTSAAATSTAMSQSMSMGSGSMSMVFTNSHNTPLFSSSWTPTSTGAFAGTCIFLIVLALIARLLQAWRHMLEARWHDRAVNRRYVVVAGKDESELSSEETSEAAQAKSDEAVLTVRGLNEKVRIVKTSARTREATPWRLSVDLPRACIFTVQAGVGYLLMLAVMTLNVGYFLSVLGGLFLGELLLGRFAMLDDGHH